MNKPFAAYALTGDEMARWDTLVALRDDVNGVLEAARGAKLIGKPLEAAVALYAADADAAAALESVKDLDLAELFIVSKCTVVDSDFAPDAGTQGSGSRFAGLKIAVTEAAGVKCPRCWMHSEDADSETGLCPRCAAVMAAL